MKIPKKNYEKGITLTALIITIIVLIILTTVSINILFGKNGLITMTQTAANMYKESEQNELAILNDFLIDQPLTAKEMISKIQLGWSLGNTLECYYSTSYEGKTVEDFETHWKNPITSKQLIDTIKNKGFNTLRIPVTWYQHLDMEGNIDPKWLARVKEIIDYGIQNNMYVIVNTHHEKWFNLDGSVSETELQEKLNKIWKQIADEFKDYSYKLIFEVLNEPRNIDALDEWVGNNSSYEKLNRIEKNVLKTIRNSGGNNNKRCVLLPVYAATIDNKTLDNFEIPQDNYVIISVHSYSPSNFTKSSTEVYSNSTVRHIETVYNLLDDFIKKNPDIAILLVETGCYKKEDGISQIKWAHRMMTILGRLKIPCIIWDNGDNFNLINRDTLAWNDENLINTIFTSYKEAIENNNNTKINILSNINEETVSISYNKNIENLIMETQIKESIRHFTLSSTNEYTGGTTLRFKFSDTYSLSGNDYYKLTAKIKTNMSELKLKALIYFYDENDNLLYTGNYDTITPMIDGSKNEYQISFPYYVEGAKKVRFDRISISSSYSGIIKFDLYDLQLIND